MYWNWSDFFVSGLGLGFYFKLLRFFFRFQLAFYYFNYLKGRVKCEIDFFHEFLNPHGKSILS